MNTPPLLLLWEVQQRLLTEEDQEGQEVLELQPCWLQYLEWPPGNINIKKAKNTFIFLYIYRFIYFIFFAKSITLKSKKCSCDCPSGRG